MTDLDALDPSPAQLRLESGTLVELERLRARQFFKFLKILTKSALPALSRDLWDSSEDSEEFMKRLLALTIASLPDAEDEAIEFLRSMVKPVGLIEGRKLNKQDAERNVQLWLAVDRELDNPSLDDLVTIVEAIVQGEAADIQALGKRLGAMFTLAVKTGQLKQPQNQTSTKQTEASSEDSPEPSTFSPASTAGVTTSSQTYASGGYGNASQPYESAGTTPSTPANNG